MLSTLAMPPLYSAPCTTARFPKMNSITLPHVHRGVTVQAAPVPVHDAQGAAGAVECDS